MFETNKNEPQQIIDSRIALENIPVDFAEAASILKEIETDDRLSSSEKELLRQEFLERWRKKLSPKATEMFRSF